jgi:hypothetical protein
MANTLYFSHDFDARNDPKIAAMRGTYKSAGYGYYWIIVEMMAGEEGHKLPVQEWLYDSIAMAAQCRSNSIKQFIVDCIEKYKLFNTDGEYFWSETLIKRMKKYEDSIEQKIKAGRKGAETRWKNSTAKAPLKHRDSTVVAENSKLNKTKLNKSIGYSSGEPPPEILSPVEEQAAGVYIEPSLLLENIENHTPEEYEEVKARADNLRMGIELFEKNFPILSSDRLRMHKKIIETIDSYGIDLFKAGIDTASGVSPPPGNPLNYIKGIMDRKITQEVQELGL